jgi:hypothetical protein
MDPGRGGFNRGPPRDFGPPDTVLGELYLLLT